jgi:hypothetical protein
MVVRNRVRYGHRWRGAGQKPVAGRFDVARIIDSEHAVPALGAMVGCCTVDGGPTAEQRSLIGALAAGYLHVPFDVGTTEPLTPEEAAAAFTDEAQRHRLRQLLVFAELCRHPLTEAQVARTDAYAAALGGDRESMSIARDLVGKGVAEAREDFFRSFARIEPGLREPTLAGAPGSAPITRDADLVARLRSLRGCPQGSLGWEFVAFHDRYGFALPGEDDQPAAVFVAHDMTHVIAGYEPDGVGEIALGAMQLGMTDSDEHWVQFLGNLGVHEAGYVVEGAPPAAALSRPGAVATVAHAFDRGARCTGDFTVADHLSMVDEPLEVVRSGFGVPAREC